MENTPFIPQTAIDAALDRIAAGEADCFILQPGCEPLPGHGRGVRPLLQLLENQPGALRGAVLADKIIGKAAAMVAALGGIAAVHTLTASEAALDFLAKRGIPAAARQTVPYIINRTGDDMCPLEKTVREVEDPAAALPLLKATIAKLMAANAAKQAADNTQKRNKEDDTMDYLGANIPKLGFGLMRLPMLGDEVDIEQTKQMVVEFLAAGFTYFDTAYGYLGGKSEKAAKTALVDRYPRESFQLATKLPAWAGAKTAEEARQMFYTSLERTGAGYFDFYLLHNLGDERTRYFDDYGIWDFVKELKAQRLVRHIGFSFHDKAEVLDALLSTHPETEFVQLQINYADWDSAVIQSRACYEVARKHNKPVIIMEPVKGGSLANLPAPVAEILHEADPARSQAAWALRFAASLPGLVTVLSGMSDLAQMRDNLATMKDAAPLTADENAVICAAQTKLAAIPSVPCTDCRYCVKDCPAGVAIPGVFKSLNTYLIYGNLAGAKGSYGYNCRTGEKAAACLACGQCESVCPQHINIIERLREAAELLGG